MTCNPAWLEIKKKNLHPHQTAADRPDVDARIFKLKLSASMQDIVKSELFGKVAYVKVIEFQKRTLLHSHTLFIRGRGGDAKLFTTEDIDL